MANVANMVGIKNGSFVVIGLNSGGHERIWRCRCELCGAESLKSTSVLRRKNSIECRSCFHPVVELSSQDAKVYIKGRLVATIDASDVSIITRYKTWYQERRGYLAHRNPRSGVIVKLHREICGAAPGEIVDHIDGDATKSRSNNLRFVSPVQSSQNRKRKSTNTSGVTGVVFSKYHGLWESRITVSKKNVLLGRFVDKEEAISVRKAAEVKYFGEHARTQI